MKEFNRVVPFPVEVEGGANRDLEKYLIDLGKGVLPRPDEFGDTLQAGRVEAYANWLSNLTQNDGRLWERGTVPHIDTRKQSIILPTNPNVGDRHGCTWTLSKKRDTFVPTINIHSHPYNICFSTYRGDLYSLMSGWGDSLDFFVPNGVLAACPDFNYLILKSSETPPIVSYEEACLAGYSGLDDTEYRAMRRFGSQVGRDITNPPTYWKIFGKAETTHFGGDFSSFYDSYLYTYALAEKYHLGFYYSAKDGNYIKFSRPAIFRHISKILDSALQQEAQK